MTINKITDAIVEPVSLGKAKAHLRVDGSDEDALILALVTAARTAAEGILQRALCMTTWELTQPAFAAPIILQMPPILAVASVKYIDEAGVEQTLAADQYRTDIDSAPGQIVPALGVTWPAVADLPNAVRVRYTAGYASVPAPIVQWILLHVGHYYRNREAAGATMQELPYANGLLDPYRIWRL